MRFLNANKHKIKPKMSCKFWYGDV